jgi:uncharacterized membrane protein (DUF4010 family)
LVTLIILPVLPNREFTDFHLNPRRIWQIVVLVSSIGFAGYVLSKKFGAKVGLWLSGLLGGLVSSTAVSLAAGRIARSSPDKSHRALQATILAGSVMYLRILVLIWIIQPRFAGQIWWKLVIPAAVGAVLAVRVKADGAAAEPTPVRVPANPFEIRPALIFASLFVLLSIITSLAQQHYGGTGLVILAGLSGIADIDPFILSVVGQIDQFQSIAATVLLVSMMSNTIAKGMYFGVLAKEARRATAWRFALWAVLHLPLILIS